MIDPEWRKRRIAAHGGEEEEAVLLEGLQLPKLTEEDQAQIYFHLFLMYKRHGNGVRAREVAKTLLAFPEDARSYDFEVPSILWEYFDDAEGALAYIKAKIPAGLTLESLVHQWAAWASILLLEREIQIAQGKASKIDFNAFTDAYIHAVPRSIPLKRTLSRNPALRKRKGFKEAKWVTDKHY